MLSGISSKLARVIAQGNAGPLPLKRHEARFGAVQAR